MCFLLLEMFLPSVFSRFSSFRAKRLISSWRFLWSCSSYGETEQHNPSMISAVVSMGKTAGRKIQFIHRKMAGELCEPPHRSSENYKHMGICNIVAHECCHTCFRSKILLVSCILSTLSFRIFTNEPSSSCWNTYSWCSQLFFFFLEIQQD